MRTSVVSDPGRRRSAPVFDEDLDQILRNSRRDLPPPRGTWWGPRRVRTRPTKETLDDADRCDVVAGMGDRRRSARPPLGLGPAAGTICAPRTSPIHPE